MQAHRTHLRGNGDTAPHRASKTRQEPAVLPPANRRATYAGAVSDDSSRQSDRGRARTGSSHAAHHRRLRHPRQSGVPGRRACRSSSSATPTDATDPDAGEPFPDVIVFWVASEGSGDQPCASAAVCAERGVPSLEGTWPGRYLLRCVVTSAALRGAPGTEVRQGEPPGRLGGGGPAGPSLGRHLDCRRATVACTDRSGGAVIGEQGCQARRWSARSGW